nr:MAG TPA: hypothetical protein [Bacteriophage sp.]
MKNREMGMLNRKLSMCCINRVKMHGILIMDLKIYTSL